MTTCREREGRRGIPVKELLRDVPTMSVGEIYTIVMLNRSATEKSNGEDDENRSDSENVFNKPMIGWSGKARKVKRTAALLALVILVVTFPTTGASYADTEDLINELDRPSK